VGGKKTFEMRWIWIWMDGRRGRMKDERRIGYADLIEERI